jgi:23S rRNA (uracil1939-C5)-methyltransferase
VQPGAVLTLDVEKPAAGGRMLARHQGQVVLVWGAIPGERVEARVERTGKGVLYAETVGVLAASSDRRAEAGDWRCGGSVLSHVAYERQLRLKGEIVRDAFLRLGRIPLGEPPPVTASPEDGYRMRARLHADGSRLGFYREGTHQLCDAAATRQLLPAATAWMSEAEEVIRRERLQGLAAIELAENIAGDVRACHLELHAGADPERFGVLGDGLAGLSASRADRAEVIRLRGTPAIVDRIRVAAADGSAEVELRRDVRAFFQGNRFLLEPLVQHVAALMGAGPIVDMYAGVGLFGLAAAALGAGAVTLVEGDPLASADLDVNAAPFASRVAVARRSVEGFLAEAPVDPAAAFVVDPPRTGLSKEAAAGVIRHAPARLVYVSCDVATLARDARLLLDAGYTLQGLQAFDLFPNTAHVETVALFLR